MKGWRWLAPAVLVLLAVTAWPLGRTVWTSLHDDSLTSPDDRRFIGLDHYTDVLSSRTWWLAVGVTMAVVVATVLVQLVLGVAFAAALRRLTIAWPVTRVLVLLPFALLSIVVAVVSRDAVTTGFVASWFDLGDAGPVTQLVAVRLRHPAPPAWYPAYQHQRAVDAHPAPATGSRMSERVGREEQPAMRQRRRGSHGRAGRRPLPDRLLRRERVALAGHRAGHAGWPRRQRQGGLHRASSCPLRFDRRSRPRMAEA